MADEPLPKGIRVSGKGFRVRVRHNGKEYGETIKGFSNGSLTRAVKARDKLLARIELGIPLDNSKPHKKLFEDAAQEYLDTLEARTSTIVEYTRILNGWWWGLKKKPIEDITGADIKKILASMNVSSKTKKNRLIPLYGVFNFAEIQHPKITIRREQASEVVRYSPEEKEALLSRLDGQAKVYFSILFGCGLRPGEALALEWADYSGEALLVSKSFSKRRLSETKTGVRRKVYVPTWVRPVIGQHSTRFAGGYIFQNLRGRPHLDTDVFNHQWREAHRRARIQYRVPYTCRHTRAAELLSAGVQPAVAGKQLGHSVEMFLRVYSEFIEEYSDQDMSLLEGLAGKKREMMP